MGVREEFFRLKEACIKSKGEERKKAEQEMDAFFTSITPEQQEELQEAVSEDFARIHKEAEELEEIIIRKQMNAILPIISTSYLARHYFGKSTSWFYQRFNGNKVHGKVCTFTKEEIETLKNALRDIGNMITNTSLKLG